MKMVDATPAAPSTSVKSYWPMQMRCPLTSHAVELMLIRGDTLAADGTGLQTQIPLSVQRNRRLGYGVSPILSRPEWDR